MADNSIINALKGIDPAEAMPFGAAATPEGSPTALSAMLSGLFGMPKHLVQSAQDATPGLRREDMTDVPGKAQPNDPLYNASAETALALAGTGAPAAEAGAAGIFGGKLAKTADLKALQEAEQMRMHGEHPDIVRQDTGWFRTPTDGKWKFEIPDNRAKMLQNGLDYTKDGTFVKGPTRAMFEHPELFEAYPQIRDSTTYNTVYHDPRNTMGKGSFNPNSGTLEIEAPNLSNARSIGVHELQHAVQNIEGFSPGANPGHYAGLIEKGIKSNPEKFSVYDWDAIQKDAYNLYHKTGGEVEARNVQKRMDYSPLERRIIPPWGTQDVQFKNQVIYDPIVDTVRALKRSE